MAPTWNNSAFFFPAPGRHAPPSLTSARLNVITTALSTRFPALSRVTYTPCFKFCADKFDMLIKLWKNEGNLDVRNMLSDSRKKIIDHNKTRLRHVIKFVEFCGRQERIPKKQDGRLVGRTSSFRGEYSQLFFHKLSAFLDYSNHKQFFLFKAFASIASAPPLRKILAAPLYGRLYYRYKLLNILTLYTKVTGNEQFSLFITVKQYSFSWKTLRVSCLIGCCRTRPFSFF